jgi:hypothetical protein
VECRKRHIILSADNYIPVQSRAYYNYEEQSDYVDYIIMMDYDEHWSTSEPGSASSLDFFRTNLTNALSKVDSSQLICGCPFYTRIYSVKDGQSDGREYGMQEAIDAVTAAGVTPVWDESVGQYTASWSDGDTQMYAWLEEERSFTLRMQAVKEVQLRRRCILAAGKGTSGYLEYSPGRIGVKEMNTIIAALTGDKGKDDAVFSKAGEILRAGGLVAFPTEDGLRARGRCAE